MTTQEIIDAIKALTSVIEANKIQATGIYSDPKIVVQSNSKIKELIEKL